MPQRSSRRSKPTRPTFSCRPSFELLEDRSVPAVLAAIDGNGLITVTFDAANDSATIAGTASGGTAIDVTDNTTSTRLRSQARRAFE